MPHSLSHLVRLAFHRETTPAAHFGLFAVLCLSEAVIVILAILFRPVAGSGTPFELSRRLCVGANSHAGSVEGIQIETVYGPGENAGASNVSSNFTILPGSSLVKSTLRRDLRM